MLTRSLSAMKPEAFVCALFIISLSTLLVGSEPPETQQLFPLKIIHFNDLHAKFDETTNRSVPCDEHHPEDCLAGFARLAGTIKRLRQSQANHLLLNAGDVFQGTAWYSLLKWNVSQHFTNLLRADAMVLGNHEFDDRLAGLVPYLEATVKVTPMVAGNLKYPEKEESWSEDVKRMKSLIREEPLKVTVGGETFGIIGVVNDETDKLSNTSPMKFRSSVETVRRQAKRLKEEGVNKIIVLSHCGILDDRRIASAAGDDIDIIVGGHSHTLLYSAAETPSGHSPYGPYPMVVSSPNGRRVLIVQAFCHGHYVGNIDLSFNLSHGEIESYGGQPVYQASNIEKDVEAESEIQKWKSIIVEKTSTVLGRTEILLDNNCSLAECRLGSSLADAYLWYFSNSSNPPRIAMIHTGNFRNNLEIGQITTGDVVTAVPFSASAVWIKVTGAALQQALEKGGTLDRKRCGFRVYQVAGIKVTIDLASPVDSRTTVLIKVGDGYESLNVEKMYDVVANSYMLKDGGRFGSHEVVDNSAPHDNELFQQYVRKVGVFDNDKVQFTRIEIQNEDHGSTEISNCKSQNRK